MLNAPTDSWRWQSERYVVLKINNSNFIDQAGAEYELKMSQRLTKGDPQHQGARFVRTVLDNFQIIGPHGMHVCLVYEPMRETLSFVQRRFEHMRLSLPLVKAFVRLLLKGLDYLHSDVRWFTLVNMTPSYAV